jgi:hypothetical protein
MSGSRMQPAADELIMAVVEEVLALGDECGRPDAVEEALVRVSTLQERLEVVERDLRMERATRRTTSSTAPAWSASASCWCWPPDRTAVPAGAVADQVKRIVFVTIGQEIADRDTVAAEICWSTGVALSRFEDFRRTGGEPSVAVRCDGTPGELRALMEVVIDPARLARRDLSTRPLRWLDRGREQEVAPSAAPEPAPGQGAIGDA